VLPPTYWPAAKCIAEKFTPTDCTHFAPYRTPWWAFHFVEKRAICGSAVFLTDIFQLEWRLGFVPYFCCCTALSKALLFRLTCQTSRLASYARTITLYCIMKSRPRDIEHLMRAEKMGLQVSSVQVLRATLKSAARAEGVFTSNSYIHYLSFISRCCSRSLMHQGNKLRHHLQLCDR
jgi:hypothetical protein